MKRAAAACRARADRRARNGSSRSIAVRRPRARPIARWRAAAPPRAAPPARGSAGRGLRRARRRRRAPPRRRASPPSSMRARQGERRLALRSAISSAAAVASPAAPRASRRRAAAAAHGARRVSEHERRGRAKAAGGRPSSGASSSAARRSAPHARSAISSVPASRGSASAAASSGRPASSAAIASSPCAFGVLRLARVLGGGEKQHGLRLGPEPERDHGLRRLPGAYGRARERGPALAALPAPASAHRAPRRAAAGNRSGGSARGAGERVRAVGRRHRESAGAAESTNPSSRALSISRVRKRLDRDALPCRKQREFGRAPAGEDALAGPPRWVPTRRSAGRRIDHRHHPAGLCRRSTRRPVRDADRIAGRVSGRRRDRPGIGLARQRNCGSGGSGSRITVAAGSICTEAPPSTAMPRSEARSIGRRSSNTTTPTRRPERGGPHGGLERHGECPGARGGADLRRTRGRQGRPERRRAGGADCGAAARARRQAGAPARRRRAGAEAAVAASAARRRRRRRTRRRVRSGSSTSIRIGCATRPGRICAPAATVISARPAPPATAVTLRGSVGRASRPRAPLVNTTATLSPARSIGTARVPGSRTRRGRTPVGFGAHRHWPSLPAGAPRARGTATAARTTRSPPHSALASKRSMSD